MILQALEIPETEKLNLTSFGFDDISLTDDETCLAGMRMFLDLKMLSKFKIQQQVSGAEECFICCQLQLQISNYNCS